MISELLLRRFEPRWLVETPAKTRGVPGLSAATVAMAGKLDSGGRHSAEMKSSVCFLC